MGIYKDLSCELKLNVDGAERNFKIAEDLKNKILLAYPDSSDTLNIAASRSKIVTTGVVSKDYEKVRDIAARFCEENAIESLVEFIL